MPHYSHPHTAFADMFQISKISFLMEKNQQKKTHPLLCVFSLASNKNIQKSDFLNKPANCVNLLVRQRWLPSESFHAAAPGSDSTLAQHLNSCTSSAGSQWRNPQPLSAYGCLYLIIFSWGDVKAPFYCCVAHFYLNYDFISKEAIIYVATDELWCSSLLINAALHLHFSFPASLIYLPVTNKPLGGNISPAAVL